jgi:hypothetical protein
MKKIRLQKVQFDVEPIVSGRQAGFKVYHYDMNNAQDVKRIAELNLLDNGYVEVIYKLGESFKPDACRERKPVYITPTNVKCIILADGESFTLESPATVVGCEPATTGSTPVSNPKLRTKKEKAQ